MDFLKIAQDRARKDEFELSRHAQKERLAESISVDDIVNALVTGRELEPYPSDPRGPSCLFVGQGLDGRWLHVLCGNFQAPKLLIITVYRPQLPWWKGPFTRGR